MPRVGSVVWKQRCSWQGLEDILGASVDQGLRLVNKAERLNGFILAGIEYLSVAVWV